MLCYTCYILAAKQRKWASYGPPISYFLRKMQQFWICVVSTPHFILCRKSVEITAFFAASTSVYYRQLPICSLRLQRLKIPRPSKACRFEPGYQHQAAASNVLFAAAFLIFEHLWHIVKEVRYEKGLATLYREHNLYSLFA